MDASEAQGECREKGKAELLLQTEISLTCDPLMGNTEG